MSGGGNKDGEWTVSSATGAVKRTTTVTKTTASQACRRRSDTVNTHVSRNGSEGGGYRTEGAGREESADKSAEWSGADTKGSSMEKEAETVGGSGGERDADGNGVGNTGERRRRDNRGNSGRWEQNREGHLRGR